MFYGVFIFNMFFLVWLSWPVSELQCSCESDWFQCEALQSFAEPKTMSLNRLQQPDDLKARKVKWQEPPPEKEPTPPAIMFKHEEHSERVQQLAGEARTARVLADEARAARVQSVPPSQFAQPPQPMGHPLPNQYQPMLHVLPGQFAAPYQQPMLQYPPNQFTAPYHQPMMQVPPGHFAQAPQTMATSNMSSSGSGGSITLPKPTSKSSMIQEHDRHMHVGKTELEDDELVSTELLAGGFQRLHNKRRNKQKVHVAAAKPSSHLQTSSRSIDDQDPMIPGYFKIYDGVTARTPKEMPETCHPEHLEAMESQTARESIDVLRTGTQPHEISRVMLKMMYLCLLDETCAAVSWTLQKVSDHASQSTLCTMRAPLELHKTDPNQQPSNNFDTVFMFKDFEAAGQAGSSKETQHRMTMLLEDSSEEEANQFVEVIYRASCRCADDDSCRQYLDGQSWCYIAEESYYKCKASGYSIFADEEGKFWTSGLCSKGNIGCTYCSGIGHKPPEGDSHVHGNLLQEHKTNYGSSCDKWHDTDQWPWCFVGFDSSCVDRMPGDIDRSLFNSSYRPQFWSHLPCERSNQHERERAASGYCENIAAVESIVTILHLIGSFLMMFVLFKWISNQCGDNVKAEDMFAIESSEEEDDADDTGNDDDDGSSDGDSFQAGVNKGSEAAGPNFKGKEAEKKERDDEQAQSF